MLIQLEHILRKINSLILLKVIDGNSNVESFIYRNTKEKKCNAIIDLSSSVETINYTDGLEKKKPWRNERKLSLNGFRLIFFFFSFLLLFALHDAEVKHWYFVNDYKGGCWKESFLQSNIMMKSNLAWNNFFLVNLIGSQKHFLFSIF